MDLRDALFGEILKLARKHKEIMVLTADMTAFTLDDMAKELPDRVLNVGIAEQNMINVATGLALSGKKVFCYTIASFLLQRAYEQIKINLSDMNLPITLIGIGAERDYATDGGTHQIMHDREIIKVLPHFSIYEVDCEELARKYVGVAYSSKNPVYLRVRKV